MKIYKVDQTGKLISLAEAFKKMAQTQSLKDKEFEITIVIDSCYKMADDGIFVKYGHSIKVLDEDGVASEMTHLGAGEGGLIQDLFQLGGREMSVVKESKFTKEHEGFFQAPDRFTEPPPPPPPGGSPVPVSKGNDQIIQQTAPSGRSTIQTIKNVG